MPEKQSRIKMNCAVTPCAGADQMQCLTIWCSILYGTRKPLYSAMYFCKSCSYFREPQCVSSIFCYCLKGL